MGVSSCGLGRGGYFDGVRLEDTVRNETADTLFKGREIIVAIDFFFDANGSDPHGALHTVVHISRERTISPEKVHVGDKLPKVGDCGKIDGELDFSCNG